MSFGESLQRERKKKGLTQEELSKLASISREAIGNYENNRRTPTIETARKLSEALEINYFELIGWTSIDEDGYILNDEGSVAYSELEKKIVEGLNKLNEPGQQKIIAYIQDLVTHPKYKK